MTGSASRAYIGSFTSQGGRGITVAAVDQDTGALRAIRHVEAVPDPSYLAVAAPGGGADVLYAVSEAPEGRVAAYALTDPNRPAPLGEPVEVAGSAPTHLAVDSGWVFTANYGSGSVSALRLGADGAPTGPAEVYQHHGSGPVADRQGEPHAHAVVAVPGDRWLLAVDLGTDAVWRYARAADGALAPRGRVELSPGCGARHLAPHPAGDAAYVVGELDSTLAWCAWDAASGELEPRGSVPLRPADARGANYPSGVAVDARGRYAYVANRGDDTVAVLALDAATRRPELVATVACGGTWPRDLTLGPGGRLYCANERSGNVSWFDIDPSDGTPWQAGSLPAPAASCVVFR